MTGPSDTDPQVVQMQLERIRQMSPARRFAMMASWSKMLMQASYQQFLQRYPDERRAKLEWVRQQYGENVAARLEKHL
jgi:hypothetical protein